MKNAYFGTIRLIHKNHNENNMNRKTPILLNNNIAHKNIVVNKQGRFREYNVKSVPSFVRFLLRVEGCAWDRQ